MGENEARIFSNREVIIEYWHEGEFVRFKIHWQRSRRLEPYRSENGLTVKTSAVPEYSGSVLYLRGSDQSRDNDIITLIPRQWERVLETLQEWTHHLESPSLEEEFLTRIPGRKEDG